MKENKLVEMKNKIASLTNVVQQLITDLIKLDTLSRGTLTALQLHLGEVEWNKIVEELKELELKEQKPEEKKLEL